MKLWRYIQGHRKGKDAHKLEKEAMSDPFLAHALRGFDRVDGDHIRQIEQIRKDISRQGTHKVRYFRAAGIAASILLVIGVGTYFMVNETKVSDNLPVAFEQEIIPVQSAPEPPQPVIAQQRDKEQQQESLDVTLETEEIAMAKEAPVKKEAPVEQSVRPAAAEREMQIAVEDSPVAISVESEAVNDEELITIRGTSDIKEIQDSVELNEVEVVGYRTQKKQTLTGAVAGISISKDVVRGRVVDQQGEPIIGASVQVEGTNNGTLTNMDGCFEIPASDGSKIRVNYIGYEGLVTQVNKKDVLELAMNEDKQTLDEVVVTGYGADKKSVLKEPKPVDGMRKYKKYLKENMVRPTDSECGDVKGNVVLQFYVGDSGRPYRITVKESLCPSADEEAIRLLEQGPDWKKGEREGTLKVEF